MNLTKIWFMFEILISILNTNYCNAYNYGFKYRNIDSYGLKSYQIKSPDDLFGADYGSNYGSTYGSSLNYRPIHDLYYGSNFLSNNGSYISSKTSGENKRPKLMNGLKYDNNPRTLEEFAYRLNNNPSESYPNPQIFSNFNNNFDRRTQLQQLGHLLPLIIALAKQLSTNQPVIQNFVNPSLHESNNSFPTDYKHTQESSDRFGELYQRKRSSKRNKNKISIRKILMEDLFIDKKA